MKKLKFIFFILFVVQMANCQAQNFEVEVSGQGDPVLLIPGLTCPAAVWNETIQELSSNYECHAITVAGFAGLPPTSALQSDFLTTLREDMESYIDGLESAPIVIGHSLGGFTAMNLAIHAPKKVKKVVVVDSYPSMGAIFFGAKVDLEQARSMYHLQRESMMELDAEGFENMQRATLHAMIQDSMLAERALEWSLASDRHTTFQAYEELIATDLRDQMDEIQCPTLILQAGMGPNYSEEKWSKINKGQYGNNRNIEIERNMESMHFIMFDAPEWLAQQLNDFL